MSAGDGHGGTRARQLRPRKVAGIGLTLLLGTAGGYAFLLLGLPLPWMMGAMCVTTVAALAGMPVIAPNTVRDVMLTIIGLMIGSAFSPDILGELGRWTVSLGAMAVYTVGITLVLGLVLKRFAGFTPPNAFCSSAPGALIQMIMMGSAMGGDERVISVMHTSG